MQTLCCLHIKKVQTAWIVFERSLWPTAHLHGTDAGHACSFESTLVAVAVPDEAALMKWASKAGVSGVHCLSLATISMFGLQEMHERPYAHDAYRKSS